MGNIKKITPLKLCLKSQKTLVRYFLILCLTLNMSVSFAHHDGTVGSWCDHFGAVCGFPTADAAGRYAVDRWNRNHTPPLNFAWDQYIPGEFLYTYEPGNTGPHYNTAVVRWENGIVVNKFPVKFETTQGVNPKNLGQSCSDLTPTFANPITIGTGNKIQVERDFESPGVLQLERVYNSSSIALSSTLGPNWSHTYTRKIYPPAQPSDIPTGVISASDTTLGMVRQDGQQINFNLVNGIWQSDLDINDNIQPILDVNGVITGWQYTHNNDKEIYDTDGKLVNLTLRGGLTQTLAYDVPSTSGGDDDLDTLDTVTGPFGRTLSFTYDVNARVTTVTDPEGAVYHYTYSAGNNLESVTYPDNNTDPTDNPQRIYYYEDAQVSATTGALLNPRALTGITNENGDRFATWAYDAQGRAISSEHAGGVESGTLDYTFIDDVTDPRVTVTNPLGKDTTYHFTTLHGVRKVTQVEGHATAS